MSPETLKLVFDGASLVIAITAFAISIIAARRKGLEKTFEGISGQFKQGSDRMDRHDLRIQSLEHKVAAMPAREDLHQLQLHLVEMSGDMKEMRAALEANGRLMGRIEAVVTRHEDHLLDGAKR